MIPSERCFARRLSIRSDAPAKAWLYRHRFLLLSQRLSRIPQFSRPSFNGELSEFGSCENTIVLAQGEMQLDGIFQLRLAEMESRAVNDMFVILSDVWLDHEEKTMAKLETVLDGYEDVEVVPSLFVLMGNFCSRPFNLACNSLSSLRSDFAKLGKMIGNHQRLKENSRFLFIPGPDDAGPSTVLPRCALPKFITEELRKHIPNAIFASNPCRVKFYTQEIVFFRQDLLYRMRKSCLIPYSTEETSDYFEHIVLGDKSEQKAFKYTGITCFNPGSFSNDFTFVVYRPCNQEVELSALES
ncbi:hypothetical protein L1987_46179 [Smallanthus sonchifolius]|uniref:Uncharacterized protein n=1 Tax=Smallanthus sonchifolius TaxID=185202 RepID=A0ACB9FZN0_9ASTR|nr:hypothetical protein L1987_46179 [Smallanthus sonchifolius]